ncbi:MAG: BirA family transcriptional regulator biotin operon repressor / biotin-acetyl-CoA-carboxylase ligase [Puniceicoccaceae bacterium 5H]|nr:MAG: BirA family transcriptional regulator biotin operon repressor / biotin-acetyl-CoA-carboxylase ligase [Puniceicoccaceae bacterium 5H]
MSQTDVTILQSLLTAKDDFVSGNDLAQQLGISRVGVWARLEKLRESGFVVEAVRHRGYRLMEEPRRLNEPLLLAYLASAESQVPVFFHETLDSTNSEAERRLANGQTAPFVVVSGSQTRGRGRLGRRWYSPDEGNLYISFAFRPETNHARMQAITIWLGLTVCHYLREVHQLPVQIKWPNDLIINNRKVAGMLTEARIDADRTRDLVFGLGLNVSGKLSEWPLEVAEIATTLSEHAPSVLSINNLAADLIKRCTDAYQSFIESRHLPQMLELWQQYDAFDQRVIRAEYRGKMIEGVAGGIDERGALKVNLDNEQQITVNSGEVTIGTSAWAQQRAAEPANGLDPK